MTNVALPELRKAGYDAGLSAGVIAASGTLGLICPPVGMNVFVINSIARDISLGRIYWGVSPFIVTDIIRLTILCIFPALSLFLPRTMA